MIEGTIDMHKTTIQRLRERTEVESGFTLIELLIVITILGILAAIVVFAVGTTGDNAKTSACQADKHTLEVGLEARKAKDLTYPASGVYTTGTDPLVPNYMREAPTETFSWDTTTGAVTAPANC